MVFRLQCADKSIERTDENRILSGLRYLLFKKSMSSLRLIGITWRDICSSEIESIQSVQTILDLGMECLASTITCDGHL